MSEGGNSARSDLLGGAGWMAFGALVLGESLRMDRYESMGATLYTMPGFGPGLIGLTLIAMGFALSVRGWWRSRIQAGTPSVSDPPLLNGRVAFTLALSLFYAAVLIGRVPFTVATASFVTVFVWTYAPANHSTARRALVALLAGVLTTVAVVLVFERIFLVHLP